MPLSPKPLLDSHLVQAPPPCSGPFLSLYPLSRVVSFQGFHRNYCFLLPHQVRYLHMPYSSHYCSCPSPWSPVPSSPLALALFLGPFLVLFLCFFYLWSWNLWWFQADTLEQPLARLLAPVQWTDNVSSTCTGRCLWIIFFVHVHLYRGTLTRSSSEFDLCMSYLRHISSARSSSSLGIFFGMEIQGSMSWRQKVLPTYITSIRIGIVSTIMVPRLHCFGGVGIMDILCVHTHMQLAVGKWPKGKGVLWSRLRRQGLTFIILISSTEKCHWLERGSRWRRILIRLSSKNGWESLRGQDNPCEAMWGCNPIRGKIYWLGSSTNIYGL